MIISRILFTGKWLFSGGEVIDNFALVAEDGLITWVGEAKELASSGFEIQKDLGERYITPGLIDSHVHLLSYQRPNVNQSNDAAFQAENICRGAWQARQLLRGGVVACRDLGSTNGYALGIREAVNKGYIKGPYTVAAGRVICATGGHGNSIGLQCDGVDQVIKGVRQVVKEGADLVKIMASGGVNSPGPEPGPAELTFAEIKAAVDAAHALGRKVAAHAHGNTAIRHCVEAGVDSIEHGVYLSEDIMTLMVTKGIYLVPTLSAPYYAVAMGLKKEPNNPDHAESKAVLERHRAAVLKSGRMGVKIAFGTDVGSPYNPFDRAAYELVLMVEAGFKPSEALTAATQVSADLLGIDDKYGTLQVGRKASFLSFKSNPLEQIEVMVGEKDIYWDGQKVSL